MNILIVSPHRDDAAFSLALSITRWVGQGHKITILNVFSRSLDAPYSDAETVHENDRLTYCSALRRREDESFAKHVPRATPAKLMFVDLNLKDAPIRLRCERSQVRLLDVDEGDTATPKLEKALATHAEGKGAILAPMALGNHIDHLVVRKAVLAMGADLPVAFYEDLPDALEAADGIEDKGAALESTPAVVLADDVTGAEAYKRRMVVLYGSQVDGAEAQAIAGWSARYGGGERVWTTAAWRNGAAAVLAG